MVTTAVAPELTKAKKAKAALTPAQKQASQLRRDAAMLERLAAGASDPSAMLADAAKYKAQADKLAPKAVARPTTLTEDEWGAVEGYFLNDLRARLLEGFSIRKLKAIASAA